MSTPVSALSDRVVQDEAVERARLVDGVHTLVPVDLVHPVCFVIRVCGLLQAYELVHAVPIL